MMIISPSNPKISLITINYLQIEVTLDFLKSTDLLTYPNYEIILVDNGALEDQSELVKDGFPQVIYMRSERNLGFAGANNLGMSIANGDYFFIVNNDTEVTPDLLQNTLEPFLSDDTVGAVSPKIMYFERPSLIQYAGFTEVNPITGRNKMIGNREEDCGQFDIPSETSYAHGAAMLVKREVVEKVGKFCEDYFMYYEELDWSTRMTRAGFQIRYAPQGVIYHKDSVSIGKSNPVKTYYYSRNRILFMRRNSSRANLIIFYIYLSIIVIPINILRYLVTKTPSHISSFCKGILWNLKNRVTKPNI